MLTRRLLTALSLVAALLVALLLPSAAGASTTTSIAFFNDPAFVDQDDEALNTLTALQGGGNSVTPFVGTTIATWGPALDGADVLVLPELEVGGLSGALDADSIAAIQGFTSAGGRVIVFGSGFDEGQPTAQFLNPVFGFSTGFLHGGCDPTPCDQTAAAATTEVATGPLTLPYLSAVSVLTGLPAGSLTLYEDTDDGGAAVAVMPYGDGAVVFVGWDLFDAPPQGAEDGGWLGVLNQLASQPEIDVDIVISPADAGDPVIFAVTIDAPVSQPVIVDVQTSDITAVAGVDYEAVSTSVTIPAGETLANVDVPTLPGAADGVTFALEATQASWGEIVVARDIGQITAQVAPTTTTTAPTTTTTVPALAVVATPRFTG